MCKIENRNFRVFALKNTSKEIKSLLSISWTQTQSFKMASGLNANFFETHVFMGNSKWVDIFCICLVLKNYAL